MKYGEGLLKMEQKRLPFDISLQSLEPYEHFQAGFTYSFTSMKINFKRNQIGLLFGSFFVPTLMFATLSLISYTINPDIVSIFVKVYNSNRDWIICFFLGWKEHSRSRKTGRAILLI